MAHRLLLALVLLSACEAPHALRFFVDDLQVETKDLGLVTLTQPRELVLTVENLANAAVTLHGVHLLGDLNAAAFTLGDSDCNAALAPNERCQLRVIFDPISEARHETTIVVRYEQDQNEREVRLALSGRGRLDCAISEALSAAKQRGASAAEAENSIRAAEGADAGRALSYDHGYDESYSAAYQQGHSAGYSSGVYDDAYQASYNEGVQAGRADAAACNTGIAAGERDGYVDGVNAGRADGRAAGESDGYDDGHAEGARDGKTDCGSPARDAETTLRSALDKADPTLLDACVARGHDQAINVSAYSVAYRDAASRNPLYQSGRADGFNAGYATGAAAGAALAFVHGDERGYDDGFSAGSSERFAECYDATYVSHFNDGYGFAYASNVGYDAGYDSGFKDGYSDAYAEICG